MTEMIKDTTQVVVDKDGKGVIVTRTLVERFDADEYLRKIAQLHFSADQNEDQVKELREMAVKFGAQKDAMTKVREKQVEQQKKDMAKAAKSGVVPVKLG